MQPDPLSPQQEEQPESMPAQEMAQSEPISIVEVPQLEPVPVQEIVKLEPAPIQEVKPRKRNTSTIVLGILTFILLVAVAGLGYWGFTLNTKLTTTQQQLTALQGEQAKLQSDYAALTSDKEKLNTELTQTKADLEKANTDLANAQADLKKSEDQNKSLQTKISEAQKRINVAVGIFVKQQNDKSVEADVRATKDAKLLELWNKFLSAHGAGTSFLDFMSYLFQSAADELK